MEISITKHKLSRESLINAFIKEIKHNESELNLLDSFLFNDFPVYKDLDEEIVIAQILLISSNHGVLLFHISESLNESEIKLKLNDIEEELDNLYSIIFTRLLRNKRLRKNKRELLFPINALIYAPHLSYSPAISKSDTAFCINNSDLHKSINNCFIDKMRPELFAEIKSTIEGSKALIKTKVRNDVKKDSKGDIVNTLEKEIASFDLFQRSAYTSTINGVSRVRGLAGSGKTVVLAINAALTHLKYPDARIAYTFYTKSLHQHIKRLITRFYRQFQDTDPDWEKLDILHAWGSSYKNGIYYNSCIANEIIPLSFSFAARKSSTSNAFEYVCNDFVSQTKKVNTIYDYIFIDEGQDFTASFLKLCLLITKGKKIFWAYDELQTIFLPDSPTAAAIFGQNEEGEPSIAFEEDIILYKCYRNPREILLIAHAIGFGIYGRIVQMIENSDYWQDIGYIIKSGELNEGSLLKIERPQENSLDSISSKFTIDEIVTTIRYNDYTEEIYGVTADIYAEIKNGLLPEDILVITVDDRNATIYLNDIQEILAKKHEIKSNNIHADRYSVKEFQIDNRVTLSTVHKAKGNEAYSVFIVGADAIFSVDPTIRERNMLFTAMTRSKAWVHISGIGKAMDLLINEINLSKAKFPYLEFQYPSSKDLRIMKRDIKEEAIMKSKSKKLIENALAYLSSEEIKRYLDQITTEKKIK
ncbi:MAG: ATP-binding domain-containing protein [Candidatus Tenebribacter davisii]|nr:ATP-binding domain-containing protein [Candidatus Tenebribacter davisii]